jgi:hypothetical protein
VKFKTKTKIAKNFFFLENPSKAWIRLGRRFMVCAENQETKTKKGQLTDQKDK